MLATVLKIVNPLTYICVGKTILINSINNSRRDALAGSGAPLFKAMLLTGVVGYSMEYAMLGSK
jgi:hypothetical protein